MTRTLSPEHMTGHKLDAILRSVTYPGYVWRSEYLLDKGWIVWATFIAACSVNGDPKQWTTRKWYISQYACRSEVIGTLFLLVKTALEHEAREVFKVDGDAVYDPHVDVDALASVCGIHEVRA